MSTKLQKQFEKTARSNPYSSYKVKGKIATDKDYAALDISKTQPQRKKSAPLATFKSCQKAPASHTNSFVPIPELGIYSPDQHVLQNGTFAQHCHNRDVNRMNCHNRDVNRMNCPGNLQLVDSNCSNASSNSSFDEPGSHFSSQKKGVVHDFDNQDYNHKNDSRADIYQIPSSQQHTQDIFNHQSMQNPSRKPVRNETVGHNYRRVTNPARSNRNVDNIKKDKLSPSARSHSLSDLSTGLTLSLVGQKKYDSVLSINGHSQVKSVASSSSSRGHATRGPPVLRDIENRLMETTMSCRDSVTSPASLYSNSKLQADQDKGSCNQFSSKSVMNGYHEMTHQTKQNTVLEQPYQQKLQNQQLQYFQHKQHPQLQKEHAACEDKSRVVQQTSFPRSRKDSEDTTSSHRSAHSDLQSCEDLDAKFNNRLNMSAQTSDMGKTTNRTVNPFSCVSARNAVSCLKENDVPERAHSAVVNSHQPGYLNKEQSVVKPRRSLPNVPLNEASERIKRFTEMMKSRLSANNSANKNSPVNSHSSKYTPSRMSSIGSACSQTSQSIQTPDPSDSDVFVSANTSHYQGMTDLSQRNGFLTVHKVSSKEEMCSPRKSSGYYSESDSGAKNASVCVNGRKNVEEEVGFHHLDHRINNNNIKDTNSDDVSHRNLNQGSWHGQYQGALTFGETPHAAADQSLDSGQTTETSNSYNGSVLDSGYTTNNDGENDSCGRNPPRLSHYYHKNQKEYSQHADQHKEISASNYETKHCGYHLQKHSNNLVNSHNFGSVQNIYPQYNGNTRDFNLLKSGQFIIDDKHKHLESQSPVCCYKRVSNKSMTESKKNGSISAAARSVLPLNHLQLLDMHLSANRRSWDCANDALSSLSDGFPSNQMKRYEKAGERYRSSDVLPSSRGFVDGNYKNNHQSGRINLNEYRQQRDSKQSSKAPSENSVSDSEISQLNGLQGFTPVMPHSSHSETKPGRDLFNHHLSAHNHDHPQKFANSTCAGNMQSNGHHKAPVEDNHNSRYYKLSNGSHKQQDEVQSPQIPASRVNGLTLGYPCTGGFGASEANCTFQRCSTLGQEMSLFHMTQRYDLSPVLINLPQDELLKDLVEFGEFSLEMSLAGVPAVPNSLHGKAAQIGTPGSAFTPVKNSVDRDKPLTAQLKVICFSSVLDDIHKYTTLGRLLKGDIVLEVNGWFCLGADGVCVRKFIENCTEAVTFTVARLKESDDVRFKGQTAVERIKGLESEISRLDELIQARNEKIKNLTFATGALNVKQHAGTLSEVNGKIPFEGMVIGCDEYVV